MKNSLYAPYLLASSISATIVKICRTLIFHQGGQGCQPDYADLNTVKPDSLNLEYATHNQGKRRIQVKIEYTIDSKSVVFRVFIRG
jgi:hypothetical protein